MTEVRSMQDYRFTGKRCKNVIDPYPLDVWGATGGKNNQNKIDKMLKILVVYHEKKKFCS